MRQSSNCENHSLLEAAVCFSSNLAQLHFVTTTITPDSYLPFLEPRRLHSSLFGAVLRCGPQLTPELCLSIRSLSSQTPKVNFSPESNFPFSLPLNLCQVSSCPIRPRLFLTHVMSSFQKPLAESSCHPLCPIPGRKEEIMKEAVYVPVRRETRCF